MHARHPYYLPWSNLDSYSHRKDHLDELYQRADVLRTCIAYLLRPLREGAARKAAESPQNLHDA